VIHTSTDEMESRLTFSHSQLAQTTTFQVIASKLGVPALSEEQKEQVRFVFGSTLVMNEVSWSPESEPRTLDVAVSRCQWFSDCYFRLKVYGEFAQVLNPHFPYDSLPRPSDQVKDYIKYLYLAVLLDDSLVGHDHLGCLKQALRWVMDTYCPDQVGEDRAREISALEHGQLKHDSAQRSRGGAPGTDSNE